jgi:hypothetical protein
VSACVWQGLQGFPDSTLLATQPVAWIVCQTQELSGVYHEGESALHIVQLRGRVRGPGFVCCLSAGQGGWQPANNAGRSGL